ncbi:MAG: type II toxin-antitoxin system ParD family antitoxin [Proteobacteria bacterium]|nr:type II toxin-antitoxin system ParD family antitoxin [Pseudomonadota bacterium]
MNISLNNTLEKFIQKKIETGLYNSASEVVREGIRLLMERDMLFQQQIQKLNHEIEAGLRQLQNGESISGPQVFEEIKKMSDNRHKTMSV